MALAVNGSGTIFKKCDRSNHRPDSNKGCASSTCQHTCGSPERCQHAWTLRYWVNGKQVEKSFKDKQHPTTGRVDYGSGKKLARDWQLKLTVDKRSGDITFTDHSKGGKQNFGEACEQFIARMRVGENSRDRYLHSYRAYVQGVFGGRTLAQVAQDRDGVTPLCHDLWPDTIALHQLRDAVPVEGQPIAGMERSLSLSPLLLTHRRVGHRGAELVVEAAEGSRNMNLHEPGGLAAGVPEGGGHSTRLQAPASASNPRWLVR